MDNSGKNRYELLFMDDDVSDPLDNIIAKKKQVKTAPAAAPGSATKSGNKQSVNGTAAKAPGGAKKPNQAEKENKPSAMNKNETNKKPAGGAAGGDKLKKEGAAGAGAAAAGGAASTTGGFNNNNRKRTGPGGPAASGEVREGGQGQRNANFRQQQQSGETREQRNNRRNVRENGFNNAGTSTTGSGAPAGGDGSAQQPRQYRDRGENRGPPRNNRNFEGGNRGGKREFDRQSGSDKTGVKAVDKRDGAGAHNWGSVKETIDDVNKNENEAGATTGEKADDSGNEQAEQVPVEEETKELTLDEWKAQKGQRAKPTYNIRKAGEGEDTSQWKKMIVLNNNKKKDNESEEELEFDPAMYPQRVGRQQRVLDIQFNFNDGRRGGGGFGGRGRGGRGARPGGPGAGAPTGAPGAAVAGVAPNPERPRFDGGARTGGMTARGGKRNFAGSDRQQNAAPKVNDERQFPTLA